MGSDPPPEVLVLATERLWQVADLLKRWPTNAGMSKTDSWIGVPRQPGARTLTPAFVADTTSDDTVSGRVTFTRFYLGGAGAVHGGAIPLLFDQVLGGLVNTPKNGQTRTAYLNVNFRQITPIGSELELDGSIDRQDGRKLYVSARLRQGEQLLADAEGLFVVLRPNQP